MAKFNTIPAEESEQLLSRSEPKNNLKSLASGAAAVLLVLGCLAATAIASSGGFRGAAPTGNAYLTLGQGCSQDDQCECDGGFKAKCESNTCQPDLSYGPPNQYPSCRFTSGLCGEEDTLFGGECRSNEWFAQHTRSSSESAENGCDAVTWGLTYFKDESDEGGCFAKLKDGSLRHNTGCSGATNQVNCGNLLPNMGMHSNAKRCVWKSPKQVVCQDRAFHDSGDSCFASSFDSSSGYLWDQCNA